jgi:hypothetical protein
MTRLGSFEATAIRVIEIEEVLVAKIVSGLQISSYWPKLQIGS